MTIQLLVIDPQNDFVDPNGALSVKGALDDAKRLATLVEKCRSSISNIHISLDSHHRLDISHPLWFINQQGQHPKPFTVITVDDLTSGVWQATQPSQQAYTLMYLKQLSQKARFPHVIWPEHCLIGSEGHAIPSFLFSAFSTWSQSPALINFIHKGQNPSTEHFSVIEAEVPDLNDQSTQINHNLIAQLEQADEIWVTGWARSHCLGNSVKDLIKYSSPQMAKKLLLVSDATSDVPGFEAAGESFLKEAQQAGMRVSDVQQLIRKYA